MDGKKALYRKYFPNAKISDADLTTLLNSLAKYYPNKPLKDVFGEMGKDNAFWSKFKAKYPYADIAKFHLDDTDGVRNIYYGDHWAWGESKHDKSAFSGAEASALGNPSLFPKELTLGNSKYPIPGIGFQEDVDDIANSLINLDIFVTPTTSFLAPMRNIFGASMVRFTSGAQGNAWLNAPNYYYWPQQLNFAVWCATCGCGISLAELDDYPKIIQGFLKFHVYFTTRRVLYEMGVPLPDESAFSQTNNVYTKSAFSSLCNEFGVENADYRFKGGRNHGMGNVYVGGDSQDDEMDIGSKESYWPRRVYLFEDEGATARKGNKIYNIHNNDGKKQHSWFVPKQGNGLTRRGMGRINRSLEAFVYCVLGAQVNIRSGIVGDGGGAVEAQQEMQKLFESAVVEENLATSVQRFQLAVQEAKLRLDMAIAPGIWLMPSNLVINTESIVGYNNELQKAGEGMQFGINVGVNEKSKSVGIMHNLGDSKVKLPHTVEKHVTPIKKQGNEPVVINKKEENTHETNKTAWMIGAAGLGWWLFR